MSMIIFIHVTDLFYTWQANNFSTHTGAVKQNINTVLFPYFLTSWYKSSLRASLGCTFFSKKQIRVTQCRAGEDSVSSQKCALQGTCFCAALWSRGHRWFGYSGRSAVPVTLQITSEHACLRGAGGSSFSSGDFLHAYIPINVFTVCLAQDWLT